MWSRRELKSNAKNVLKLSYWKAFLISAVTALIGGYVPINIYVNHSNERITSWYVLIYDSLAGPFSEGIGSVALLAGLIIILWTLFVTLPVAVGNAKYYIESTEKRFSADNLCFAFKNRKLLKIIKTLFITNLFIFLWSLLFLIPGIVKSYSYKMVPYILAENPDMDTFEAITLSRKMMDGHKFDTFVLELSFIGWGFLSALIPYIGVFLLLPYIEATFAELYVALKKGSIASGLCSEEDFQQKPEFY